ncbi:hypothetical protein NUSPORA_01624 [Nucleospora cyclopteri]
MKKLHVEKFLELKRFDVEETSDCSCHSNPRLLPNKMISHKSTSSDVMLSKSTEKIGNNKDLSAILGLLQLKRQGYNVDKRKKKTKTQICVLEKIFKTCSHPNRELITDISLILQLHYDSVYIWFVNRRSSEKDAGGIKSKKKRKTIPVLLLFSIVSDCFTT